MGHAKETTKMTTKMTKKDDKKDDKKEDKGSSKCKQCGKLKNGTPSCCATGGSWEGSCGTNNQGKPYTWTAGIEACAGNKQDDNKDDKKDNKDSKCKQCGKLK